MNVVYVVMLTALPACCTFTLDDGKNGRPPQDDSGVTNAMKRTVEMSILTSDSEILFRVNSYCSCRCCNAAFPQRSNRERCDRDYPTPIPRGFRCPQSFCFQNLTSMCRRRDEARCEQACFCRRCAGHGLAPSDHRCRVADRRKPLPSNCACASARRNGGRSRASAASRDVQAPCAARPPRGLRELWNNATRAARKREVVACVIDCFCSRCNKATIAHVVPSIFSTCRNRVRVTTSCRCSSVCPTATSTALAQQLIRTQRVIYASSSGR